MYRCCVLIRFLQVLYRFCGLVNSWGDGSALITLNGELFTV